MLQQVISRAAAVLLLSSALAQAASAQGTTTLRTPLIPGAQSTGPLVPPLEGDPPAVGDGPTPVGVIPGMGGPPPALNWVPAIPSNQLGVGSSGIALPFAPAIESPPGVLGPALTGFIPAPPSVLGADPGILQVPPFATGPGNFNPAMQVPLMPGGGLPGTGGYNTSVPQTRRSGQQTHQFGGTAVHSPRHMAHGAGSGAKGSIQDQVARTGPVAGFGLPFGVPTGNGFDKGTQAGSELRNSSIDLGGGQRMKIAGVTISTGSSVQDFGLSDTRNNGNPALTAQQATEFGQGFRNMTNQNLIHANTTTDFGLPYDQFNAANLNGTQKTGQRLLPQGIETNF